MAGTAARPLPSIMMRSNLMSSSSVQPSISFKTISILYSDLSFSDSEIYFFNAFISAPMLTLVSSGAGDVAGTAARPLPSIMMRSNLMSSSSVQPSISFKTISILYSDLSFSDSEIYFFNAFISAPMLTLVSSGAGDG